MLDPVFCFFKRSPTRTHLSGSLLRPIVCVNISVLCVVRAGGPFCIQSCTLSQLSNPHSQRCKAISAERGHMVEEGSGQVCGK